MSQAEVLEQNASSAMDEYDELRKAGFTAAEIQDYMRPQLTDAGFSDQEIGAYFQTKAVGEGTAEVSAKASLWDYFQHGVQGSVPGLRYRGKMPDAVSPEQIAGADWLDRLALGVGQIVGDIPVYAAGGFMGGIAGGGVGSFVTAPAGAMALTEGLRASYMKRIQDGHWEDAVYLPAALEMLKGGAKGGAVGATTGGAGSLAAKGAVALGAGKAVSGAAKIGAEVAAMPTAGAALEGRLPQPQEFVDAAVLVGTLHGVQKGVAATPHLVPKLRDIYAKTGKTPEEVARAAQDDPTVRQDLMSVNVDVPKAFATEVLDKLKKGQEVTEEELNAYKKTYWAQAAMNEREAPEVVQGKLASLYADAIANKNLEKREAWGFINEEEAARISEKTGLKITAGFTHTVNVSEIQHAIKYHGVKNENETLRGQIPISENDIKKIPEIVRSEKALLSQSVTENGKPAVIYEYSDQSGHTIYIEEVHTGKHQLAFKDMWIMKRPPAGGQKFPGAYVRNERGYEPSDTDATSKEILQGRGKAVNEESVSDKAEVRQAEQQPEVETAKNGEASQADKAQELALEEVRPSAEKTAEPPAYAPQPETMQSTGGQTSIPVDPNKPVIPANGAIRHEDAVSLSKVVEDVAKALDVPIRTGKMGASGRGALGIFKVKPEVIRLKVANDVATVMHEAGHFIQKALFGSMDEAPLKPFEAELAPMATTPRSGQSPIPEGFAEFVAKYVVDPKEAQDMAPKFYAHFESLLQSRSPEFHAALQNAREAVRLWAEQPAVLEVLSHISVGGMEKEGWLSRILSRDSWDRLYTNFVDRLFPLKKATEMLAQGQELPADQDPYILARTFAGAKGKATHFIEHSPFEYKTWKNVGKPLAEILRQADNLDELRAYLVARRGLELEARGVHTGVRREAMQATVDHYKGSKYEGIARELDEYQDHVMQYLVDAGVLSEESATLMRDMNRQYVPFYRVMESEGGGGFLGSSQNLSARNPVRRIRGSGRDIVDPLESILKNTYAFVEAAEKNAVGRALTDLAEKTEGSGWLVEKLPAPKQAVKVNREDVNRAFLDGLGQLPKAMRDSIETLLQGSGTDDIVTFWQNASTIDRRSQIVVYRDGKRQIYQVAPELAEVINGLNVETVGLLVRLAAIPAKLLRAGATLTPDFMIRNMIRDAATSGVVSRSGFVPGLDTARGLAHAAKKDQAYWDWVKAGGDQATLVSMDRTTLTRTLEDITATGYPERVWNVVKNPLELLRLGSELSEKMTRIGEFSKAAQKHGTDKAGMMRAGYESRDLMDFSRRGRLTRSWNVMTAFFNASIQGMDRTMRGFRENPRAFVLKAALYIGIPSIVNAIVNYGDEDIKEIPRAQRDMFWCFPVGEGKNKTIVRIPKPFELGVMFGSTLERTAEFLMDAYAKKYNGDINKARAEAFRGLGASIWDVSFPNAVPTTFAPFLEHWANRSIPFDRPIVPKQREGLLPEYQYAPHTTELMKTLSHLVGALPPLSEMSTFSPARAENYVRAWTGGLGMYFLQGLDYAGRKAGMLSDPVKPAATLADSPFVRAFVIRHPSMGAESIQRFYDSYDKASSYLKSINALQKDYQFDDVANLIPYSAYQAMEGPKKALNDITKSIDFITKAPGMSADQKRQMIDALYFQAIEISRLGNKTFEKIQPTIEKLKKRAEK